MRQQVNPREQFRRAAVRLIHNLTPAIVSAADRAGNLPLNRGEEPMPIRAEVRPGIYRLTGPRSAVAPASARRPV